jgi:3-phenylpropionate/cinnamic acid dioxygenase small subunit
VSRSENIAISRSECEEFYYKEAEILDSGNLHGWLELLTEDIDYSIPVRVTKERAGGTGFSSHAFFLKEDRKSLETRIKRFESEYAWSEEIPSRTRRFVTNVRVEPPDDDQIRAKSNILLFRSQGNTNSYFLVSGERRDVLERRAQVIRIRKRVVFLDHTILPMANFSVFL